MGKKKKRKTTKGTKILRRIVKRKKGTILSEANYILRRAQEFDSRVVSFGPLLFFSTQSGDAWMLDHGDGLALCLAKEGEPQSVHIDETDENFKIEWTADYQVDGEVFNIFERSSQKPISFFGYPIPDILRFSNRKGI
jgi:hypothetical protein